LTRVHAVKELEGKVVSAKMDKTAVVLVVRYQREALYGKRILQSKRYKAHDENNECEEGDFVAIKSTNKLSKTKSTEVSRIIRKVVKL
jgi:small subunit ribosomal protein S17